MKKKCFGVNPENKILILIFDINQKYGPLLERRIQILLDGKGNKI